MQTYAAFLTALRPECQTVSLAQLVVFVFDGSCVFAPFFPRQESCMVLRGRPGRNTALGQAHSPAIELCLKRARLAGLFRPTGRGGSAPKPFQVPPF
jgi:hypothetical protein